MRIKKTRIFLKKNPLTKPKMAKNSFLSALKQKVLVLDGGMGTSLQEKGFSSGCAEELNIKNPNIIKDIHKEFIEAGSDIVITNTFGANRIKLKQYKLDKKVKQINEAAVKIARKAAKESGKKVFVAGDIGPIGKYIEPLDELTFDEAYEVFSEQVKALSKADFIFIETVADIKILKAAIIAAKQNSSLPVVVNMTFENKRSPTGTDVETYTSIADSLGVDIIGSNCGGGPKQHLEIAKIITKNTNLPVVIQPNAGLPKIVNGETVFEETPANMSKYTKKFLELGVNIIGGCCGTTPDHINAIAKAVKNKKPKKRKVKEKTKLCSRTKTIVIEKKTKIVGERINPTGRKELKEEIKNEKTSIIRKEALQQVKEKADILDINVGVPGTDEVKNLKSALNAVQNVVDVPLVIDTSNPEALEEALKNSDGKPLVNSVNGKKESLDSVLPLVKKYGAAILCLALDEKGIPKTADQRVNIAKKIIKEALKRGIKKQDIIIDSLTLTIATNPENEKIILESVKKIKKLGYKTILGVSNISHGLPNRSEINSKFLTKAKKTGLDLAIINPLDNINQKDTNLKNLTGKIEVEKQSYDNLPIEKQLYNAILFGDKENIIDLINKALKKGKKAMQVNDILINALDEVGDKFKKKVYFLPQVLLCAAAMKKAFTRLRIEIKKEGGKSKGKVVIATVKNDIHDIGKNIVIALLESHNYEIVDLGKDVPAKKIIEAAKKHKPRIIALSALMTTTAVEMEKVINELRKNNIKTPVIVGGAVITPDYAKEINADYAKDALEAVKVIEGILR